MFDRTDSRRLHGPVAQCVGGGGGEGGGVESGAVTKDSQNKIKGGTPMDAGRVCHTSLRFFCFLRNPFERRFAEALKAPSLPSCLSPQVLPALHAAGCRTPSASTATDRRKKKKTVPSAHVLQSRSFSRHTERGTQQNHTFPVFLISEPH